jgi:hypothetical protein
MQNRKSNHINNDNAHKNNYFWQSIIGGTTSFAGLYSGILHASFRSHFVTYLFPYAFVSTATVGVGLYGVKRLSSICIGNNDDLSKSEAKSQMAIAATAFGASTLVGWDSETYYWKFRHSSFGNYLLTKGLTESILSRSYGMVVVGTALVVGFVSPILVNKVQNGYQEIKGINLKEKAKFFLFKDRGKNIKVAPTQNEEIKDTNNSVLRK